MCSADSDCSSGCCSAFENGNEGDVNEYAICQEPFNSGGVCGCNSQCLSGVCDAGKCTSPATAGEINFQLNSSIPTNMKNDVLAYYLYEGLTQQGFMQAECTDYDVLHATDFCTSSSCTTKVSGSTEISSFTVQLLGDSTYPILTVYPLQAGTYKITVNSNVSLSAELES